MGQMADSKWQIAKGAATGWQIKVPHCGLASGWLPPLEKLKL